MAVGPERSIENDGFGNIQFEDAPMRTISFLFLLLALVAPAYAQDLKCNVGPSSKSFGGVPWLVYACDDKHSVVLVSAPGSPAMPFYFSFAYEAAGYHLRGEGTGSKAATDAALAELGKLTDAQIADLFNDATKSVQR